MNAISPLLTRRRLLGGAVLGAALLPAAGWFLLRPRAALSALPPVTVWKDPECRCCDGWIAHMGQFGFALSVVITNDMPAIKKAHGVPEEMQSCHTAHIDGYVIEGHVPAGDIKRLIRERPTARGLAVPGMPASAPGMDRPGQPYDVMLFGLFSGGRVYAHHTGLEDAHAL